MSHNILRADKTCLNCRHVVQERFCPNCGQENIESRKTFYQLFVHFFEDLTHYENAFWRTIRNLILKPASLTKEYLSGKRLSYLAPVRLYIFISFISFFLFTTMPGVKDLKKNTAKTDSQHHQEPSGQAADHQAIEAAKKKGEIETNPIQLTIAGPTKSEESSNYDELLSFGYESLQELDSLQKNSPKEDRLDDFEYNVVKKSLEIRSQNTTEEILKKFKNAFIHDLPKALFVYMPIFAFFLWLFHNKKRWYYFDHGIFTLHYFSFLLLAVLLVFLFDRMLSLFGSSVLVEVVGNLFSFIAFSWMFYYFFPAHHRFYGETRLISLLKSVGLLIINIFLMVFLLTFFALYTFLNIH